MVAGRLAQSTEIEIEVHDLVDRSESTTVTNDGTNFADIPCLRACSCLVTTMGEFATVHRTVLAQTSFRVTLHSSIT